MGPLGPALAPLASNQNITMLEHIYNVQQKYENAVVLTQVGSFMELYFDQALKYGPALNLKVAVKSHNCPIPGHMHVHMAGFPLAQKEKYEGILVKQMGEKVVTLMQDSRAVLNGDPEHIKRPVTRILTPGTLLGESFVDESVCNYLASLHISGNLAALMWVDLANGEVLYEELPIQDLGNSLARISPSEIIIDPTYKSHEDYIRELVSQYAPKATISKTTFPALGGWRPTQKHLTTFKVDALSRAAQKAFLGLSNYIYYSLPTNPVDIQPPTKVSGASVMQLDASARTSLDLLTAKGSGKEVSGMSLYSIIKHTCTPSGSRLLQEWISAPLLSIKKIEERQNNIAYFMESETVTFQTIRNLLRELPDCPRILQKLRAHNMDPTNLVLFANSLVTIKKIQKQLMGYKNPPKHFLDPLTELMPELEKCANFILSSIKTEKLTQVQENQEQSESEEESDPGAIKPKPRTPRKRPSASSSSRASPASHREYDPVLNEHAFKELEEVYEERRGFTNRERDIEQRLIAQYGPTVELRWSPTHGHHVKIFSGKGVEPQSQLVLARSKNTIYFHDLEWQRLGTEMLESSAVLKAIEEKLLHQMRDLVLQSHLYNTRKIYKLCDELDVIISFAQLANIHHLARPKLVEDPKVFEIKGGRHLPIEIGMALEGLSQGGFVPNDCNLSSPQPICMITGPNMGGKSTFLRQNAVIALLAQTGSFVPCEKAVIGIVDRIYCRIGAGDDLYRGRSTFMVEMLEASEILNTATERSLAIVDEVGRGTSNNDGVAIAYAAIKHLALRSKCRVLFATHYGTEIKHLLELEKRGGLIEAIRLLKADLKVSKRGELLFDYELKPGIASSSRGLLIAKLAGFPEEALKDAEEIAEKHTYV